MKVFNSLVTVLCFVVSSFFAATLHAQNDPTAGNIRYTAFPPGNAESAPPIVMLTMSRDHQYFFKAYSDSSDLDPIAGDGVDTTYKNTFEYYGYFQPNVCYSYEPLASSVGGVSTRIFVPKQIQNTTYYCDDVDGEWSGNFLNWVSMTRMDIIRKVLYGGKRVVDIEGYTVLERACLPPDAHAYTKYYNGADIARLTPFNIAAPDNDGLDERAEGITICNVTQFDDANINTGSNTDTISHDNNSPPVMRFARGNYRLWASNERVMCAWSRFFNNTNGPSNPVNMEIGGIDTGNFTYEGEEFDISLERGNTLDVSSGIDAYGDGPRQGSKDDALYVNGEREIAVRVAKCVTDLSGDLIDDESCREYPGTSTDTPSFKPVGLLQVYGEDGQMSFGLMTGSYQNNTQGGALRKNVSSFSDEIDVDATGIFERQNNSMVDFLDRVRIYGYNYRGTSYFDCNNNRSEITASPCRAWGNPISEIYRDSLLYLGGQSTPAHSAVSDGNFVSGINASPTWDGVLTEDNQCSPLNNIVFNGSVSTHDQDVTEISLDSLPGARSVDDWTDLIGAGEGIHGNEFFVGKNGNDNSELCTGKTVDQLSDVLGVCPEGPSKEGGYALSGLAHYAFETDLYPDFDGVQNVTTYGIALASDNTIITVPLTTGNEITIVPSSVQFQGGSGALVDFKVVSPHGLLDDNSGRFFGKFYVSYEVSVAGNDYDSDAKGTIEYVLDEASGEITVTTVALAESAGSTAGLFGFVISGTTQDGFHAFSGDAGGAGANYTSEFADVEGCTNCRSLRGRTDFSDNAQYGPRSHTFTLGDSGAEQLESPLFYAAKWGGFDDENEDNVPGDIDEWDRKINATGADGRDGLPDNYFFVDNPANLPVALGNTLQNILANRTASGTAPANLANADGTGGIVVQALYFDNEEGQINPSENVSWTGELHAFFIDEFGLLREDNPTAGVQGQLDGPAIDKIFTYYLEPNVENPPLEIRRYNLLDNTEPFDPIENPIDLTPANIETVSAKEINSIWSAGEILSSYDNNQIVNQRPYTDIAGTAGASRHVLTWFDKNRNYLVDDGEMIDFTRDAVNDETDSAGNNFARYLGIGNGRARRVIDFVRGFDGRNGTRSRLITEDGAGGPVEKIRRLGDIVNSSPHVVGAPRDAYDIRYGDSSYTEFRQKYQNRRQVMYIGGNDGLLHAFNLGFREGSEDSPVKFSTANPKNASDVQHALGAELWGYVPYNLLPHLRWLEEPNYSHVFYVDGVPASYDVNIFPDDADHPNGWGTILVVGMKLGGGQIGVNIDGDNSNNINNSCRDWCSRSAYLVFDITNPEKPPKLIAEINDNLLGEGAGNDLQHTSSMPALVKERRPGAGNNWRTPLRNDWKLVFGSGPKFRGSVDTNENARIYEFDLNSSALTKQNVRNGNSNIGRSFVGELEVVDWNEDYVDDVVYFGTVGKIGGSADVDDHKGALFRFLPDNNSTNMMFDPGRPISTRPLARSRGNREFLYFGTGRFIFDGDVETINPEKYYGLMEPVDSVGDSDYSDRIADDALILDVDGVRVNEDGDLSGTIPAAVPGSVDKFSALQEFILDYENTPVISGWSRDLQHDGVLPSERISSDSVAVRSQLFFTSFTPTDDICTPTSGSSNLTVVDLITGTPSDFGGLGFDDNGNAIATISLGQGRASFPQVLVATGLGPNKGRVIIQKDTGEFGQDPNEVGPPIVTLGKTPPIQRVNWREIRAN